MKKFFCFQSIQALIFLVISVAETVVAAIYLPLDGGYIALLQVFSLAGIISVRFAPQIARRTNRINSYFYRRNSDGADDEPSAFAVLIAKISGYSLIAVQTVIIIIEWVLAV